MISRSRNIVIVVAVILTILSGSVFSVYALTGSNKDNQKVSQAENTNKNTYTNAEDFQRKLKALSNVETTTQKSVETKIITTETQKQSTTTNMTTEKEKQDTTCVTFGKGATTEIRSESEKTMETVTKTTVPTTTTRATTQTTTNTTTSTTQVVTSVKPIVPETVNTQPTLENVKLKYRDTISFDMDVTVLSGLSLEEFKTLMEGITLDDENDFYKVNAEAIFNLCNQYQINEIFFCGIISAESWWGTADNCVEKNNFTGMMGSSGLIKYETTYENLEATARNLHNNYLSPGGSFNNGTTISGVSVCYCGSEWPPLVWERMTQIF